MASSPRLKILIVAQNASSIFGGEAFIPLKYFELLKKRQYPVRLIAHSRNRTDLPVALAPFIDDVSFIEDSFYHRAVWRLGHIVPKWLQEHVLGTILSLISEIHQARIVRDLVREGRSTSSTSLSQCRRWHPSTLYGFGVPVVIGPMDGGMSYPPGYEQCEGRAARAFVRLARKGAILRGLLRQAHPTQAQARRLPFRRHQPLHP